MKYFRAGLVFLTVLALLPARGARADGLRIGVIAPLSGPLADCGNAVKRGIESAQADAPALFAKLTFIYEDSQYQGSRAVAALQKLKAHDNVDLVYVFGHGDAHATAPAAERLRLPLVACSVEKDLAAGRRYVIRFFVPPELIGRRLAEYAKHSGFKRIAAVKTDTSFLETISAGVEKALDPGMALTTVALVPWEDRDFRSAFTKIKNGGFDAVGVFIGQGQISSFYRQAGELGLRLPTFGTHAFESSSETADAGGTMNGAIYAGISASPEFRAAYRKRYGDDRQVSFAGNAYDFAMLTGVLFGIAADTPSAELIMRRYKEVKNYAGVIGTTSYIEEPDLGAGFIFPVALKKISGDSFEVLSAH